MSDNIALENAKLYLKNVMVFYTYFIDFSIQSVKKYKTIVIGLCVVFGVAGFIKSNTRTEYYEAKATFYYIELNKKIYGEMLDKLRALSLSGSSKSLSEQLNITKQEALKIIDIEGLNIAESPLAEDITEVKLPFYIKLKILDRNIANTVMYKLEAYLNSNPVGAEIISKNIVKLNKRISFLSLELTRLDSLKTAFNYYLTHQEIKTKNKINNLSITEIYKKSEELFIEKTDLELTLENYKAVHILDKLVVADSPIKTNMAKEVFKFMLLGCVIGILLSIFLNAFKRVNT
jgi:hypothetical protein